MPGEFFKVIDVIAVFQILVFIFILSRQKQIQFPGKIFLIIFLASLAICLADRIQYSYCVFLYRNNFPHFYNTGDIFLLLYIPSLYLYFKSFTSASFKFKWWHLWHFIPPILVFLNLLINYYLQPADIKFSRLREGEPFYTEEYQLYVIYAFHILQPAYFIAMLYLVRNYHKQIKESYSNFNDSSIMVLYLIPAVGLFIRILEGFLLITRAGNRGYTDYILVIYAVLIVFIGYRQPKIFMQPFDLTQKSKIKVSDRIIIMKLIQLVETEKFYQDPTISLTDLAFKLDVNPRKLSACLNTQLKLSFFNYINNLRIEEAKKMLSDNRNDKNVLEILYEVGFNNKSTFNRVFKENTGLTPTEYRQQSIF